jgi:hypothetical protein
MGMRCYELAVACFKAVLLISWRDSGKPRKYAVNRACVPLENKPATLEFSSEVIPFVLTFVGVLAPLNTI